MKLRRLVAALWIACAPSGVITAQAKEPVWTARSGQGGAAFGSTVAGAGDVNGDGFADVIATARAYDGGQVDEGRAYVFLGSPTGPEKLPAWTVESDQDYATIRDAAAAGDVNGDGYGDVIVSSYAYSDGQYLEGRAWLYLGSPAGLATTPAWSAEGDEQAAYFGASVASAGDVNGDGFGDVTVSALFLDIAHVPQGEGATFLYLGSPVGLSATPAWSVRGNQADSGFVNARAGDVDGDGYDDLAVAWPTMSHGQAGEGRVFVYRGSAAGLETTEAWTAEGNQGGAAFGSSLGFADVNGDGYDDLIVGAPGARSGPFELGTDGLVVVYLGSPSGLDPTPAWSLTGGQNGSGFGVVAGAGDIDGDGFEDVLIGAPEYDHDQREEGHVLAFLGSPFGLRTRAAWLVQGNQRSCSFGAALAGAGDVDGDGLDDVIIGSHRFDGVLRNEGRALVYLGASTLRLR